jgi:hypothetical protein
MKKMRKAKVITALSLTVVMLVAMTGIAAANPENLYVEPGPKDIPYSPNSVTFDVRVYDIEDTTVTHDIKATVYYTGAGGSVSDLQFKFTDEEGLTSGWKESGGTWNWGTPVSGNDEKLILEVRAKSTAPPNTLYRFELIDCSQVERSSGTTRGTTIPEFATIAIPVAAILGLVLFFNHRKHKKE